MSHCSAQLSDLLDSAATAPPARNPSIRVVISDIEGCLNLNERVYDYAALDLIRRANQAAWARLPHRCATPLITIASGRQASFVEAFSAFIASPLPAIFEGGAGIFNRRAAVGRRHELLPVDDSALAAARDVVASVAKRFTATTSMGKVLLMTLHPKPSASSEELAGHIRNALDAAGLAMEVSFSKSAVDIAPPGVSKGSALSWLLQRLPPEVGKPVSIEETLTVGDSDGDRAMLRRSGFSAVPANASADVKLTAGYVSSCSDGEGVADIIARAICWNLGKLDHWETQ
jgi:HAD superfamily hydrolase (TIGR01484 family)